jgi:hypothetical protein
VYFGLRSEIEVRRSKIRPLSSYAFLAFPFVRFFVTYRTGVIFVLRLFLWHFRIFVKLSPGNADFIDVPVRCRERKLLISALASRFAALTCHSRPRRGGMS